MLTLRLLLSRATQPARVLFGTVAEGDAMLDGMDSGMDVNYERLDELLAGEHEDS